MEYQIAMGVLESFESDYQTKTLPDCIYLKQNFAGLKMSENKSFEENCDTFTKLVNDITSIKISISYDDQTIHKLSGLRPQYDSLVHTSKYISGKETLKMKRVTTSA